MKTKQPEGVVEKIFTSLWANGAKIEVYHYKKPIPDEYKLDRIQVLITPEGAVTPRGWLMTAEEAVDLIYGLSKTVSLELERQSLYQEAIVRLDELKKARKAHKKGSMNEVCLGERIAELRRLLSEEHIL